jgi:hypothetical protein
MTESNDGESLPSPRQQLISLLQSDFRPRATEGDELSDDGNALKSFLRHARSVEGIEARLQTENNLRLGQSLVELLAPATVTDSFKAFIVNEVRQAHAWENKVTDAVAPDRLGIVSGEGIFDPSQAQELEAQTLRALAFDVFQKDIIVLEGDIPDLPRLAPRPGRRPTDCIEAVDRFVSWHADYSDVYGSDPFQRIELSAYLDATLKAKVEPESELQWMDWNWTLVVEELRRLRDEWGGEELD